MSPNLEPLAQPWAIHTSPPRRSRLHSRGPLRLHLIREVFVETREGLPHLGFVGGRGRLGSCESLGENPGSGVETTVQRLCALPSAREEGVVVAAGVWCGVTGVRGCRPWFHWPRRLGGACERAWRPLTDAFSKGTEDRIGPGTLGTRPGACRVCPCVSVCVCSPSPAPLARPPEDTPPPPFSTPLTTTPQTANHKQLT